MYFAAIEKSSTKFLTTKVENSQFIEIFLNPNVRRLDMNKKTFTILFVSLLLASIPTYVMAQEPTDFEVIAENETAGQIRIDATTFPDANFRKIVKIAYGFVTGKDMNSILFKEDTMLPDGMIVNKSDLAKITSLSMGSNSRFVEANDFYHWAAPGGPMEFKDLTGIENLTGLCSLILLNSPNLKKVDLSKNTNLETLIIAPINHERGGSYTDFLFPADPADSYTPAEVPPVGPSSLGTNALSLLILPSNPGKLKEITIQGASNLTSLDLTSCTALEEVTLYNNNLSSLGLPASNRLTRLEVPNNQLYSLNVSQLPNLSLLNVADNRLESLDLSKNPALSNLNVAYNHLGTLDLSAQANGPLCNAQPWKNGVYKNWSQVNGEWQEPTTRKESGLAVSPQFIYTEKEDGQMGINLKAYDSSFHALSNGVGWTDPKNSNISLDGIMTFSGSAQYSYKTGLGVSVAGGDTMQVIVTPVHLMNRLYNPNSGEHFYTSDWNEVQTLVDYGWKNEEIGWVAPSENGSNAVAAGEKVFRLYNPNVGDHHYTLDSKERDALVRIGWQDEGARWYSAKAQRVWGNNNSEQSLSVSSSRAGYSTPIYRQYNPNAKSGAHNYTAQKREDIALVSQGWKEEGIGWYGLK